MPSLGSIPRPSCPCFTSQARSRPEPHPTSNIRSDNHRDGVGDRRGGDGDIVDGQTRAIAGFAPTPQRPPNLDDRLIVSLCGERGLDRGFDSGTAGRLAERVQSRRSVQGRPCPRSTGPPLADDAYGPGLGADDLDIIHQHHVGAAGGVDGHGQLVDTVGGVAAGLNVMASVSPIA